MNKITGEWLHDQWEDIWFKKKRTIMGLEAWKEIAKRINEYLEPKCSKFQEDIDKYYEEE